MHIATLTGQAEGLVSTAKAVAHGGLTDDRTTPDAVLNQVGLLRTQVTYLCMLARGLRDQDGTTDANVLSAVARLEGYVNEVAILHTWLAGVVRETEKYSSGPVDLPRK